MGSVVALGDLEGYVHFLTRDEGSFAARIKLDSNAVMSLIPGSTSSQLIAETRDGGIYAISIAEIGAATPTKESVSKESISKEPAKRSEPAPEPAKSENKSEPSAPETSNTERSIMFQKDPILQPYEAPESTPLQDSGGPGIKLPSSEP